jgi:hypothetical protein
MKKIEREARAWAAHLALIVRGPSGGPYLLAQTYPPKRKIGTYQSVASLERAIEREGARELERLRAKRPSLKA